MHEFNPVACLHPQFATASASKNEVLAKSSISGLYAVSVLVFLVSAYTFRNADEGTTEVPLAPAAPGPAAVCQSRRAASKSVGKNTSADPAGCRMLS